MNKKGFTLIEILAVIIVLGLVCSILIPKIYKTINGSNENAYKLSTQGLIDTFDNYVFEKKASVTPFSGCEYDFDNATTTCDGFTYNGKLPVKGHVIVDMDGLVNGYVIFENSDVKYTIEDSVIVSYSSFELKITSMPYKVVYNLGEPFEVEGFELVKVNSDGSEEEILDYEVLGFDINTPGEKEVVIKYKSATVKLKVNYYDGIYLYKKGNTCDSITGGWSTNIGRRNSNWYNYDVSFSNQYILFKEEEYHSNWAQSATRTVNKLDFSQYDKIFVDFYIDGPIEYQFFAQISNSTSLDYTDFFGFSSSGKDKAGRYTRKIDISNVNDIASYLKIVLMTGNEKPVVESNNLKLYNVFMVKDKK